MVFVSSLGSASKDRERNVLWVHGDHDIATEAFLAVAIARAAGREDLPLLIDLSGVTFMDAGTVGAIVGSRNALRVGGRRPAGVPAVDVEAGKVVATVDVARRGP